MRPNVLFAVLILGTTSVCSKSDPAPQAQGNAVAIPEESRTIFAQRCSSCHGADGRGSGPAAAALNPKPRNYTDKAWQGSVTDDQIKQTIVGGGPSVGKSAFMPPNPDLGGKPEVVAGLVAMVRQFGR